MPSTNNTRNAEKILTRIKGLRTHMQPGEEPLLAVPAIWDNGEEGRSMPCDVIITNQRLIGYVFVSFPRERLFLEAFPLDAITTVSFRLKTYQAMFRELLVSDGQRKVYIRAPRAKIEALYGGLRSAIEQYTASTSTAFEENQDESSGRVVPIYGRQDIRIPLERSPLGVTMLFVGGLLLEMIGIGVWVATHDIQIGFPLFIAGLVAFVLVLFMRGQQRNKRSS